MEKSIRVLIVDDHPLVREGIRSFLSTQSGIEVVGEADDGIKALELSLSKTPDVILMDLKMPNLDGIAATRAIKEKLPHIKILVITSFADDEQVFPAIKSGASGYLLKDSSPHQLLQAILDVYHGESSLHPVIASKLLSEFSGPSPKKKELDRLSVRELEVLRMIAQGMSNRDISENLNLSENTVRSHTSNILTKLHLENRTQASLYAIKEGLTERIPKNPTN